MTAPAPAAGPSKVVFALGSSFAHGDQACQLWKSFTKAKTSAAGAFMVADRSTRNSPGWKAATMANTTTTTNNTSRVRRRIFLNMEKFPEAGTLLYPGDTAAVLVDRVCRGVLHARVTRQSEIVVRPEHDHRASLVDDGGS